MGSVFFLGAGASAADGLPVTNELDFAIAHHIATAPDSDPILNFYRFVYGVDPSGLARPSSQWRKFCKDNRQRPKGEPGVPSIVEVLSVIDLCIRERRSFGPDARPKDFKREFDDAALVDIRRALVAVLQEATKRPGHGRRKHGGQLLAQLLTPEDTVITTNWDIVVDYALTMKRKAKEGRKFIRDCAVDYGCADATLVQWRGQPIPSALHRRTALLKLHGGLNWAACTCCSNLYINVELAIPPMKPGEEREPDFRCDCDSKLEPVMVAPSYFKDYRNSHLASVWSRAERALVESRDWVFVGYSLPADDLHIRAMLLRAIARRLAGARRSRPLKITVVMHRDNAQERSRYEKLFAALADGLEFKTHGYRYFLERRLAAIP